MRFKLNGSLDDEIRGSLNPFEWWSLTTGTQTWTEPFTEIELIDWLMEHFPGRLSIYHGHKYGHISLIPEIEDWQGEPLENWMGKYLSGKIE